MINIYCDESCHLEHDNAKAMLLGAISCDAHKKSYLTKLIRDIKIKHGLSPRCEIKWTSVSPSMLPFYIELIDTFYEEKYLSFRAVVIRDKSLLNHQKFNNGNHDLWYYKVYYVLLSPQIRDGERYSIFVDIKDTRGGPRLNILKDVLCNAKHDFNQDMLKNINQIRSYESELLQLTDLLIGAIGYYYNGRYGEIGSSAAKNAVVNKLFEYYRKNITEGTSKNEEKFNVLLMELRD